VQRAGRRRGLEHRVRDAVALRQSVDRRCRRAATRWPPRARSPRRQPSESPRARRKPTRTHRRPDGARPRSPPRSPTEAPTEEPDRGAPTRGADAERVRGRRTRGSALERDIPALWWVLGILVLVALGVAVHAQPPPVGHAAGGVRRDRRRRDRLAQEASAPSAAPVPPRR
jgi:hypothetical protein